MRWRAARMGGACWYLSRARAAWDDGGGVALGLGCFVGSLRQARDIAQYGKYLCAGGAYGPPFPDCVEGELWLRMTALPV